MNLIRLVPAKGSGAPEKKTRNAFRIFPPLARKDRRLFLLFLFFYVGGVMQLLVNGAKEQCAKDATLAELIGHKKLRKDSLVVELNGAIIKQELWATTRLKDGDQLELLSFVGGG